MVSLNLTQAANKLFLKWCCQIFLQANSLYLESQVISKCLWKTLSMWIFLRNRALRSLQQVSVPPRVPESACSCSPCHGTANQASLCVVTQLSDLKCKKTLAVNSVSPHVGNGNTALTSPDLGRSIYSCSWSIQEHCVKYNANIG